MIGWGGALNYVIYKHSQIYFTFRKTRKVKLAKSFFFSDSFSCVEQVVEYEQMVNWLFHRGISTRGAFI